MLIPTWDLYTDIDRDCSEYRLLRAIRRLFTPHTCIRVDRRELADRRSALPGWARASTVPTCTRILRAPHHPLQIVLHMCIAPCFPPAPLVTGAEPPAPPPLRRHHKTSWHERKSSGRRSRFVTRFVTRRPGTSGGAREGARDRARTQSRCMYCLPTRRDARSTRVPRSCLPPTESSQ